MNDDERETLRQMFGSEVDRGGVRFCSACARPLHYALDPLLCSGCGRPADACPCGPPSDTELWIRGYCSAERMVGWERALRAASELADGAIAQRGAPPALRTLVERYRDARSDARLVASGDSRRWSVTVVSRYGTDGECSSDLLVAIDRALARFRDVVGLVHGFARDPVRVAIRRREERSSPVEVFERTVFYGRLSDLIELSRELKRFDP